MPTSKEMFALASQHVEAGRLRDAEFHLRQLLQSDRAFAPALHLLGTIAYQMGDGNAAVASFRQAVNALPGNAIYLSSLAAAYHALGLFNDAETCHRQAMALQPEDGVVLNNLGITLATQGRNEEAIAIFRRALAGSPNDAGILCNLAAALRACKQLEEAAAFLREALRLNPRLAQAQNNLGNILLEQGNMPEAEACYREALRCQPRLALAQRNLGDLFLKQSRYKEALAAFGQCLQMTPQDADAHRGLGQALLELNRSVEAIAASRRALELRPGDAHTLNNLGNALLARSQLDEAIVHYQEAMRCGPGWSIPCYNLGIALKTQGRMVESRHCLEEALRLNPDDPIAQSSYVGCLHYDPDITPAQLLSEHKRWGERQTRGLESQARHPNAADPHRRLRVGYVSPDYRAHAVAFFLEPILAHPDPSQVETFCYAGVAVPDETTARFRGLGHHWIDTLGMPDETLATRIRQDEIDLLVDLTGHTGGNRLRVFAQKPAPIQLTYLGYPGTTGLSTIDYRLTDAIADPPGEPSYHTEQLLRLPGLFCCYAPPKNVAQETSLPSRKQGGVTFGSLHRLEKLNGGVLDLWARIVLEVPGSRLLLRRDVLQGQTAAYWLDQLKRRGLSEKQIVIDWLEPVGMQHLRSYDAIDIALDAFPWNGHTTACEALWMGVPVVGLHGQRHAARMVASVLSCLKLESLIAETPEDYVRLAVRLANDVGWREALRSSLRQRMLESPLCDGAGFMRGLEALYRQVWQAWCQRPS